LGRLARQATSVVAGLVIPGQGDQIWRHNIAGRPGLDPLQAVLVVLGATVGLVRRRRAATLTLLVWAAVGLLPAVLTEYPPQHGRSVMATPALALLAGAGVDALGHWRRGQPWARLAGAVAVAVSGGVGAQAYFGRWANDPNLYWAFDVGLYELGRALRAAPAAAALYETPVYREYPTFEFALGAEAYGRFRAFNGRACLVLPEETSGDTYYGVIVAEDVDTLGALRAAYPGGRTVETVGRGTDPYAVVFAIGAGQRPAVSPETARPASFGGLIDLLGYALGPAPASGGTLTLTLYWRMAQHSAAELHVFVHVLGPPRADGSPLYAQRDAGPCDNAYPSWQWAPGEVLVDRMTVEVPADVPAGDYQLGVGWYDSGTLARLQASGPTGEALGDTVVLQPLRLGTP
jgi:hypothetical protein